MRLAGAVGFGYSIIGQVTGLLFSVLIARRLRESEFGLWGYVGTLIGYSVLGLALIGSWISRDAARGERVVLPAVKITFLLLIPSLLAYLLASYYSAGPINAGFGDLALGVIVLTPLFFVNLFNAILGGYRPVRAYFSMAIFEAMKLVFAIPLVISMNLGIRGVFIALSLAYLAQLAYQLLYSRPLIGKCGSGLIKKWLKGSTVNAIAIFAGMLSSADVILMAQLSGGTLIVAYWQAALVVGLLVYSTSNLLGAISQKILTGGTGGDVERSFHFTMTLSVPALFGAVVLSDYLLWVLRPSYAAAWMAGSVLALTYFIQIFSNLFGAVIVGTEKFDEARVPTFREYLKSRVFTSVKVSFIGSVAYVLLVSAALLSTNGFEEPVRVATVSLARLAVVAGQTSVLYLMSKKLMMFKAGLRELAPYLLASAIMSIALFQFKILLGPLSGALLSELSKVLGLIGIAVIIYFPVLYALSPNFRRLIGEVHHFINSFLKH